MSWETQTCQVKACWRLPAWGGGRKGVGDIRGRGGRQKLGGPPDRESSVRPVVVQVAGRRKPHWPLRLEAVSRTLTVSQESKEEIPVEGLGATRLFHQGNQQME